MKVKFKTRWIADALFHACHVGLIELAKQILDYKGNDAAEFIDNENSIGGTSLIAASVKGHLSVVKLLVEYGCDRSHINKIGQSALGYAKQLGHTEVVEYLQGLE